MAPQRSASRDSVEEYNERFDNKALNTIKLREYAAGVIQRCRSSLQAADPHYQLDIMLTAMLEHAPLEEGIRYAAIVIVVAGERGEDAVVNIAKAWMDNLFLPMLSLSKSHKSEPSGSQTPTIETTFIDIESASRAEQGEFRNQLASRERYFCAFTEAFDYARNIALARQGQTAQIPPGLKFQMEAAHILPLSLNNFDSESTRSSKLRSAAYTWDMLRAWTGINPQDLAGSKINSPANGIYINSQDHHNFGRLHLYLHSDQTFPNKYEVRPLGCGTCLATGERTRVIEFPSREQSGIEPPNRAFIKAHKACAIVLYLCSVDRE